MLVHSMLPRSAVNGPGERAVEWLLGCDLHCPGGWNPSSPAFDRTRDIPVDQAGEWILSCRGVEGVTFSGGEPFQQAADVRILCEYIKSRRPSLSIGVFSGYTVHELAHGRWCWKSADAKAWFKGDDGLFHQIRAFLDFGVFGRSCQTAACNDKPLCGSRNQEVVFFSEHYSQQGLDPQSYEMNISEDGGLATITGSPPADL